MHHIEIADQLYEEAKHRAEAAGFDTVDEFVAEVLRLDFSSPADDFDERFTPEVNAYLNRIAADMESGKSLSRRQVELRLNEVRKTWHANPRS